MEGEAVEDFPSLGIPNVQWLEEKNCDICHFPTFARGPNCAIFTPGPIHKTTDNFSIP
jgi:hypothetical protein